MSNLRPGRTLFAAAFLLTALAGLTFGDTLPATSLADTATTRSEKPADDHR
jgi:hypothetical protein